MKPKSGTRNGESAWRSAFKTMLFFWFLIAVIVGVYLFSDYMKNGFTIDEGKPQWQESSVPAGAPLIPDLVGAQWTDELRIKLLNGDKDLPPLQPTVIYDASSPKTAGTVISQHPAPNREAVPDEDGVCRNLTITVSGEAPFNLYKNFEGRSPEELMAWLESCGVDTLEVKRSYAPSLKVSEGKVIALTYADGKTISRDELITNDKEYAIKISNSKAHTTVPGLLTLTEGQAREALTNAFLNIGNITVERSVEKTGLIIKQSLAEGEVVSCGETVDIVISKQFEDILSMPDLLGYDQTSAEHILTNNSLVLGEVVLQPDYLNEENTVISQSIPAGASVKKGTVVNITVATGGTKNDLVDWDAAIIRFDLEKGAKISALSLQRIHAECADKPLVMSMRDKYTWLIPSGFHIKDSGTELDLELRFDEECAEYDKIEDALRDMGIGSRYRFVFSAAAAPRMKEGVLLEINAGRYFANKNIELYKLSAEGTLKATGIKATADSAGYITVSVDSDESFAAVILEDE